MATKFPTRQVVSRHLDRIEALEATAFSATALHSTSATIPAAGATAPLKAMVLGVDAKPRAMPVAEVAAFGDPFTSQLLLKQVVPLTAAGIDAAIGKLVGTEARPIRKVYAIAEGAAFQTTMPRLAMNARLVFTWQKDAATDPDMLLSTSPDPNDPDALLQLIGWSESQGMFHFFERRQGVWLWAGSSRHALDAASRGQGPFDSHINGALVMKELRFPWVHWHSMARSIARSLLFPTPALEANPLFATLEGAEVLEPVVKRGVRRWTERRLSGDVQGGQLTNLPWYLRQVLWTTSVNLTSTGQLSRELKSVDEVVLPRSFFLDFDGLEVAINGLGADADLLPQSDFTVQSTAYATALASLNVHVEDAPGGSSVPGDTDFAFLVPERAFEDTEVLKHLVEKEVLSPRLALCLLMVDFSNPVFSPDRAALLPLCPVAVAVGNGGAALDAAFIAAARADAENPAAVRLLSLWEDQSLLRSVKDVLGAYVSAVDGLLARPAGVSDLLQLADSRRDAFRGRRLNEFRHTTSFTGAPTAHLAMDPTGRIFTKASSNGEMED